MSITVLDVKGFKGSGGPFAMLTAYDYLTARALDEAGIPLLLVGDTLGILLCSSTPPMAFDSPEKAGPISALILSEPTAVAISEVAWSGLPWLS